MTDDEYRALYIARLVERLPDDPADAVKIAAELYAECPRADMSAEYRDNPVLAADEAFIEWQDAGKKDDEDKDYDESECEDDEWDGDEDWDDEDD